MFAKCYENSIIILIRLIETKICNTYIFFIYLTGPRLFVQSNVLHLNIRNFNTSDDYVENYAFFIPSMIWSLFLYCRYVQSIILCMTDIQSYMQFNSFTVLSAITVLKLFLKIQLESNKYIHVYINNTNKLTNYL